MAGGETGDRAKPKSVNSTNIQGSKRQPASFVHSWGSWRSGRHQLAYPRSSAVIDCILLKVHLKLLFGSSCNSDNNILAKGYSLSIQVTLC